MALRVAELEALSLAEFVIMSLVEPVALILDPPVDLAFAELVWLIAAPVRLFVNDLQEQ